LGGRIGCENADDDDDVGVVVDGYSILVD